MKEMVTPFPCRTWVRRGKKKMTLHNCLPTIPQHYNTVFPCMYTIFLERVTKKKKALILESRLNVQIKNDDFSAATLVDS